MLPPALFYALGFALVFFGVLRLVFLGVKAAPEGDDKRPLDGDETAEAAPAEKRGLGILGFMGGGRMCGPKRHKVMGALWIVMGLYVAWTGFNMGRAREADMHRMSGTSPEDGVRVIRANVKADPGDEPGVAVPHREAPAIKAAPEPASESN